MRNARRGLSLCAFLAILISQLGISQYLNQILTFCCLNWTSSSISSRLCASAVSTGHPPVSQADLNPLPHHLHILPCLKQTLYLCCLNWTSSSVSSRPDLALASPAPRQRAACVRMPYCSFLGQSRL